MEILVGKKVRFSKMYWFDGGEIPQGEIGTIKKIEIDDGEIFPTIVIKINKHLDTLNHVDNCISFDPKCECWDDNGKEMNTIEQLWYYCELTNKTEPNTITIDELIAKLTAERENARLKGNTIVTVCLQGVPYVPIVDVRVDNDSDGSVLLLMPDPKAEGVNN